jgi:acyl dehydratase
MKYFEDLRCGEREECGRHTFTADEIKAYARRYDPQPFHLDEAAAAATHFGALTASGWHTVAVWTRHYLDHWEAVQAATGEPPAEAGPSPGIRDLRWPKPVLAGDTLTFAHEIVELREALRWPGWGLMISQASATNQKGEVVMTFRAAKFVRKRVG